VARSVPARLRSNWIEFFAVPMASAIMETQPIIIVLSLLVPFFFGGESLYPDAASIMFSLLFLHWWSMGTRYIFERASASIFTFYDILGILLALGLLTVTNLMAITDPTFLFVALVIVGWSWKRGADRAKAGLNEEQLINAFKIGFITLLIAMCFVLLSMRSIDRSGMLLRDLPIFFLAGMITLSFTRIGIIKQEQARHEVGGRREKTGSWLIVLTTTWVVLVVVSIILETLPLQVIMTLLNPLWYAIDVLLSLLLYLLDFIVTITAGLFSFIIGLLLLLFHMPAAPQQHPTPHLAPAAQPGQDSSTTLFILRIVIVVLIIIATIIITRFVQKRRQAGKDDTLDEEDEIREGLDINQILRARREERRQRQQAFTLAALEQDSVRARYRDFLQSMASKGEDFVRHPHETPAEYQARLLHAAQNIPASDASSTPTDPTILNTLTQAYSRERYGEIQADGEQQDFLRQWVPHLIQSLHEHLKSKPKVTTQKTIQSRWGED